MLKWRASAASRALWQRPSPTQPRRRQEMIVTGNKLLHYGEIRVADACTRHLCCLPSSGLAATAVSTKASMAISHCMRLAWKMSSCPLSSSSRKGPSKARLKTERHRSFLPLEKRQEQHQVETSPSIQECNNSKFSETRGQPSFSRSSRVTSLSVSSPPVPSSTGWPTSQQSVRSTTDPAQRLRQSRATTQQEQLSLPSAKIKTNSHDKRRPPDPNIHLPQKSIQSILDSLPRYPQIGEQGSDSSNFIASMRGMESSMFFSETLNSGNNLTDPEQQMQQQQYQYLQIMQEATSDETYPRWRRLHTRNPVPESIALPVREWLLNVHIGDQRDQSQYDSSSKSVPIYLPLLDDAFQLQSGINSIVTPINHGNPSRADCHQHVLEHQERFLVMMKWTSRHLALAQTGLWNSAGIAAKRGLAGPVSFIWNKLKQAGLLLDNCLLHRLLYVTITFGIPNRQKRAKYNQYTGEASILDLLEAHVQDMDSNSAGINQQDDNANNDNKMTNEHLIDLSDEIAVYHDILHPPTEQSILTRIRLLVGLGKAEMADSLLQFATSGPERNNTSKTDGTLPQQQHEPIVLRLRAYTPVLRLYLQQRNIVAALALFQRMLQAQRHVILDAETFTDVLAMVAEQGYFGGEHQQHRSNDEWSTLIEAIRSVGYDPPCGPKLWDQLATQMSERVVEIPHPCARRLFLALRQVFANSKNSSRNPDPSSMDTLSPPLLLNNEPCHDPTELIASLVQVDNATGLCPRSGAKLRLIHISDQEKEQLKATILHIARTEQIRFADVTLTKNLLDANAPADQSLQSFLDWLDRRRGEPFTVIVDGPNVGYFMQNFGDGSFSYHQIQFVVNTLERMGENPLVILPRKYALNSFYTTIGVSETGGPGSRRQILTNEEKSIRDKLFAWGKIAVVPPGMLDDYFWILASVSSQTVSRAGRDLFVPADNDQGRWPGRRPVLISNDQMRDHKLGMMEPRLFHRWYSNTMVHYNFAGFVNGTTTSHDIGFAPADFFSREIQSNHIMPWVDSTGANATIAAGTPPLPPVQDVVWHFPISGTENEWFCVRLPHSSTDRRGIK